MLAVSLFALVVLAALELNNHYLLIAALCRDLSLNLAPGHQWGTQLDLRALTDQQNLTELYRIALLRIEALDSNPVAFASAILFTACSKNCVHLRKPLRLEITGKARNCSN